VVTSSVSSFVPRIRQAPARLPENLHPAREGGSFSAFPRGVDPPPDNLARFFLFFNSFGQIFFDLSKSGRPVPSGFALFRT